MFRKTVAAAALGGVLALLVVVPAAAESGAPWVAHVADFFRATPATVVKTTAVAAFPDAVPEKPKAPADPALELLDESPYTAELAAAKARENLFGPNIDRMDPYAEQLRLANPYTEELHLVNPYAAHPISARPPTAPRFDNPYTAERIAVTHPPEPDLTSPYSGR